MWRRVDEQDRDELAHSFPTRRSSDLLSGNGDYEVTFAWDDSIVVDAEAERLKDLQEMRDGIMSRAEYRMKWYGEDEATAKAKIQEAQGESQTDDDLLGFNK